MRFCERIRIELIEWTETKPFALRGTTDTLDPGHRITPAFAGSTRLTRCRVPC